MTTEAVPPTEQPCANHCGHDPSLMIGYCHKIVDTGEITWKVCGHRCVTEQSAPERPVAKSPRMRHTSYGLMFAASFPLLQSVAREHGYALAVHGSMATDFDLIACPWIENPSAPEVLIEDLRSTINGRMFNDIDPNPSSRAHGRLAWSIYLPDDEYRHGPYLDISVCPSAHLPLKRRR